jgi:hypothetical protein
VSRNVLDELFEDEALQQLREWRVHVDKVGQGFGDAGWGDERLRVELHGSQKTFHTLDGGFYRPRHRHATYCLVYYEVSFKEAPAFIRRFLRHPAFNTHAKRLGKVVKVTTERIYFWEIGIKRQQSVEW